ncbi:MAG: hypothetical protein ACRCT8_13805 [Lacipirellulaceae bacterium]
MTRLVCAALMLVVGIPLASRAAIVAEWDLSNVPNQNVATVDPAASAANVTASLLSRGGGLAIVAQAGAFSSSGWEQSVAMSPFGDEYFEFGFVVASGYQVDLSFLNIGTRSNNTGPGTVGLYHSGDNFSAPLASIAQPNSTFVNSQINLPALPQLTGTVLFRIAQIGNLAPNGSATISLGTLRLTDYFVSGVESTNMRFEGVISAVPEPSAFLFGGLMAGAAACSGGRRSRGACA